MHPVVSFAGLELTKAFQWVVKAKLTMYGGGAAAVTLYMVHTTVTRTRAMQTTIHTYDPASHS